MEKDKRHINHSFDFDWSENLHWGWYELRDKFNNVFFVTMNLLLLIHAGSKIYGSFPKSFLVLSIANFLLILFTFVFYFISLNILYVIVSRIFKFIKVYRTTNLKFIKKIRKIRKREENYSKAQSGETITFSLKSNTRKIVIGVGCISLWLAFKYEILISVGLYNLAAVLKNIVFYFNPPACLFLGVTKEGSLILQASIDKTIRYLGVASLFAYKSKGNDFVHGAEHWNIYRTRNGIDWMEQVKDLLEIVPIVIIDGRFESKPVTIETDFLFTSNPHDKIILIVVKNGFSDPIFKNIHFRNYREKNNNTLLVSEKELFRVMDLIRNSLSIFYRKNLTDFQQLILAKVELQYTTNSMLEFKEEEPKKKRAGEVLKQSAEPPKASNKKPNVRNTVAEHAEAIGEVSKSENFYVWASGWVSLGVGAYLGFRFGYGFWMTVLLTALGMFIGTIIWFIIIIAGNAIRINSKKKSIKQTDPC